MPLFFCDMYVKQPAVSSVSQCHRGDVSVIFLLLCPILVVEGLRN